MPATDQNLSDAACFTPPATGFALRNGRPRGSTRSQALPRTGHDGQGSLKAQRPNQSRMREQCPGVERRWAPKPFKGEEDIHASDPRVSPKTAARLASLSPIFAFSVKPIDVDKPLAHAESEQAARTKADPVQRPLPNSWVAVGVGLAFLAGLCLLMYSAPL